MLFRSVDDNIFHTSTEGKVLENPKNSAPEFIFQRTVSPEKAPNKKTAIVTLTHDPKLDDPALFQALKSDAFFIGCLGSKKTHASRIKRLIDAGFSKKDTERINGPIGLNISAKSPAEISVSIMAQIIQTHNNITFT